MKETLFVIGFVLLVTIPLMVAMFTALHRMDAHHADMMRQCLEDGKKQYECEALVQ